MSGSILRFRATARRRPRPSDLVVAVSRYSNLDFAVTSSRLGPPRSVSVGTRVDSRPCGNRCTAPRTAAGAHPGRRRSSRRAAVWPIGRSAGSTRAAGGCGHVGWRCCLYRSCGDRSTGAAHRKTLENLHERATNSRRPSRPRASLPPARRHPRLRQSGRGDPALLAGRPACPGVGPSGRRQDADSGQDRSTIQGGGEGCSCTISTRRLKVPKPAPATSHPFGPVNRCAQFVASHTGVASGHVRSHT